MSYLVDSDWVADYLKGRTRAVALLDSLARSGLAVSIVTYAEILEGIYYGDDPARYQEIFDRFLHGTRLLGVSRPTAEHYARISGELRARGLLIPPPDLFIAATAIQHRLILLTRNRQHFERIPDLRIG